MRVFGAVSLLALLTIFCSPDTTTLASLPNPKPEQHIAKPTPFVAITTAYYKPVKGQRKYAQGSYLEDIHMNGTGITYSGKPARIGYLAADLRYNPIGTKFQVFVNGEDFGVWTVEDKGGAIKGPHRFDFFVGESDAGRIAAEAWGIGEDLKVEMYRVEEIAGNG